MDIKNIETLLSGIIHPAYEKDIVSLGIVEDVRVEEGRIRFRLVTPVPDPLIASIKKQRSEVLTAAYPEAKLSIIELVREKTTPKKLELGQEQLEHVGK